MSRRFYSSTFVPTTITGGINSAVTSVDLAAVSGAPASVPWTGCIDRGNGSEELVTVTNVSATTLTITRGEDGQTAKSHSAGATFEHVVSPRDLDEPNAHIADTSDAHAASAITFDIVDAKGDLIVGSADNTVVRKAVGADGKLLVADSAAGGGVSWAPVPKAVTVSAFQISAQSIPNNVTTKVTIDTSLYDTNTFRSGADFTIPFDGYYRVTVSLGFEANVNGGRVCFVYKNGTPDFEVAIEATESGALQTVFPLAYESHWSAGDVLTVHAQQDSGGALNTFIGVATSVTITLFGT